MENSRRSSDPLESTVDGFGERERKGEKGGEEKGREEGARKTGREGEWIDGRKKRRGKGRERWVRERGNLLHEAGG